MKCCWLLRCNVIVFWCLVVKVILLGKYLFLVLYVCLFVVWVMLLVLFGLFWLIIDCCDCWCNLKLGEIMWFIVWIFCIDGCLDEFDEFWELVVKIGFFDGFVDVFGWVVLFFLFSFFIICICICLIFFFCCVKDCVSEVFFLFVVGDDFVDLVFGIIIGWGLCLFFEFVRVFVLIKLLWLNIELVVGFVFFLWVNSLVVSEV